MANRVLIFAFACDPEKGSEPGAGATLVKAAASVAHEVVVITRFEERWKSEDLATQLGSNVTVFQVRILSPKFPTYLRYFAWIVQAAKLAVALRKENKFDVMHHATYASDWFINPFVLMRRVTSEVWVWGPAGGASYAPSDVSRIVTGTDARGETVRRLATGLLRKVVHVSTRRKVDVAISLNADSEKSFISSGFKEVIVKPNAVLDYESLPTRSPSDEFTVVFAGRGVRWKGLTLLLASVPFLPENWRLVIAGPGTDSDYYRKLASPHRGRVDFVGVLDRESTLDLFSHASAVALPSLHDSAPWAAAEAAGIGVPVVCLDLGGVAAMAGSLAFVVSTEHPASLPQRYAEALVEAASVQYEPDRSHTEMALKDCIARAYAGPLA